jgi:hypothetical protein
MYQNSSSYSDIETNQVFNVRGKLLFLICVLFIIARFGTAQEIKVRGGFVQEYFEVGDPIDFWMSATYPENVSLVLPDSTYNFEPFEYMAKNYYPSQLKSGEIYDTVIYTLQCYEIDLVQYLKLPAIIFTSKGDSTLIYSKADSLLFNQLVPEISDTTQLKTNLAFANVDTIFNFPMLWIILGVLAIIAISVLLIFGKKILRALKLRKLKKEYIRFSDELTEYIRKLKTKPEKQTAEVAIAKWKLFAETLENKPYSKLTSKEILSFGYTQELSDPLKNIDRFVYGGLLDESLYKYFQSIEDFTQNRYSIIVEEIKNGR